MFDKFLASLIIITSCINTSQSIADVNNIKSMNSFNTQVEFRNWEEVKKEDIKVRLEDIVELQQKQINSLEKTRTETISYKMYEVALSAGNCAMKLWEDPIIRNVVILPAAFYFGDIFIGKKITSEFGITLYKCLKEYCKYKFKNTEQVKEKLQTNNTTEKSNSANKGWHKMSKNYFNEDDYLKYTIGVQQAQLKQLEKERNKGFFGRAWTGIKKVASSVKNGVVKAVKSAWKDNLFKEKVILPITNLFGKYFTSTKIGKTVTDFVGPKITKKAGDYFKENVLGIK